MGRGAGRWQAAILEQLEAHAIFPLLARLGAARGYPLGAAEASAAHRAAKSLEHKGLCRTALVWLAAFGLPDSGGVRTFVARPGCAALDGLSVERVPGGTASTLIRGSLRQLAHFHGVSKSTVARDLRTAAGLPDRPSPLDLARRAARKLSAEDREALRDWLDSLG
jgi:hypothetical protein